jgi:hypothetical protein
MRFEVSIAIDSAQFDVDSEHFVVDLVSIPNAPGAQTSVVVTAGVPRKRQNSQE